jgi:hypothetical protein
VLWINRFLPTTNSISALLLTSIQKKITEILWQSFSSFFLSLFYIFTNGFIILNRTQNNMTIKCQKEIEKESIKIITTFMILTAQHRTLTHKPWILKIR